MTTLTAPRSSDQQWQYEVPVTGGIVVGFDGSPASHSALESAGAIAARRKCPVHVVSVLRPMSSYKLDLGIDQPRSEIGDLRIQLRDAAIRDAIGPLNERAEWTRQVVIGRPGEAIALAAERRCAELIVVGGTQRGAVERFIGAETTLQVIRASSVPVLVVSGEMNKPATVVVAIDFGPASTRAAAVALALLGDSGTLYLVYVEEPVEISTDGWVMPETEAYPGKMVVLFRRIVDKLCPPSGVVVETVMLYGSPVAAIEEFCERVGADLLATGTHRRNVVARSLLGSVSTGLVRKGSRPIVVAPADD